MSDKKINFISVIWIWFHTNGVYPKILLLFPGFRCFTKFTAINRKSNYVFVPSIICPCFRLFVGVHPAFQSKSNILSIFRAFGWTLFLKSRGVRRSMVSLCAEARFRPRTSDLFNQLFYKRNATVGSKRRANTGTDCSNPQQTYDIYNIKTTDKRGSFPINH